MPDPFTAQVTAEMPQQFADGSVRLKFKSTREWSNEDLAAFVQWVNQIADLVILDPDRLTDEMPAPEPAPKKDKKATPSQLLRWAIESYYKESGYSPDAIAELYEVQIDGYTQKWRRKLHDLKASAGVQAGDSGPDVDAFP